MKIPATTGGPPVPVGQTGAAAARSRAFALPELLVCVALVATGAALACAVVSDGRDRAATARLETDVRSLNHAVANYLASGGSLDGAQTPGEVIARLKTVASPEDGHARQAPFMNGSFVDLRLMPFAGQATHRRPCAVWDAEVRRFVLRTSGEGVSEFALSEAAIPGRTVFEMRRYALRMARQDTWVWDAGPDAPGAEPAPPGELAGLGSGQPLAALTAQTPAEVLAPPRFSLAPGRHPLRAFPALVQLENDNPALSSVVLWSRPGTAWELYRDALVLQPGDALTAYAATVDDTRWSDSRSASATWTADPVRPLWRWDAARWGWTYAELGGAMMPGNYLPPPPPAPVRLELANADEIPAVYQQSALFRPALTVDGTEPLHSPTAVPAPDFTGGWVPVSVPLRPDLWRNGSFMQLRAASGTSSALFLPSAVAEANLAAIQTLLPPPEWPAAGTWVRGGSTVAFTVSPHGGNLPPQAIVRWTADGTDPGEGVDAPPGGVVSTGAVPVPLVNGTIRLMARVYAPDGMARWFHTSPVAETTLNVCSEVVTAATAQSGGVAADLSLLGLAPLAPVAVGKAEATGPPATADSDSAAVSVNVLAPLSLAGIRLVAAAGVAETSAASEADGADGSGLATASSRLARADGKFSLRLVDLPRLIIVDPPPLLTLEATALSSESTVAGRVGDFISSGNSQLVGVTLSVSGGAAVPLSALVSDATNPPPNTEVGLSALGLAGVRLTLNEQFTTGNRGSRTLTTSAVTVRLDAVSLLPGLPTLSGTIRLATSHAALDGVDCSAVAAR